MADVEITRAAQEAEKALGTFVPASPPELMGCEPPNPRTVIANSMISELDTEILTRDGVKLRANIYRPEDRANDRSPVILNYSVYGKDGAVDVCFFPPASGIDRGRISNKYLFEAADPVWWCAQGYAVATVDARGSFQSEGDKSFYSRVVGLDGYDIVEALAAKPWSNGKVAMYGASGYAMVQWLVAAEHPPSLKAILPIDGMTDVYRETVCPGGIPETQFNPSYPMLFNWGSGLVETVESILDKHPYFDEYWQSKIPDLAKIKVPAYIICSWGDQGIHTRGTLNAWKAISSAQKWLEIHQYQKWEWATTPESLGRQKAFLDTFLKDDVKDTEVTYWPKVRYSMRERFYAGEWRYADAFPFPETDYVQFFPTASEGLGRIELPEPRSISYDAKTGSATFDLPITESFEFAGHAKLRVWLELEGAGNADIFVTLKKFDARGNEVFFPWMTAFDDGPIALGFLRASRRELDEARSTEFQPYHSHERDLDPIKPGDIVPLDVEVLPSSCRFRPGDRLRITISGHQNGEYPPRVPAARYNNTVNSGKHIIHFGGKYDTHLLLPVLPRVQSSLLENPDTVKMSITAVRLKGWSDEKFIEEYCGVHAQMTKDLSEVIPILRGYTQSLAIPKTKVVSFPDADWDSVSSLTWSSAKALRASLQNPGYKESAGKHIFADPTRVVGCISSVLEDVRFDAKGFDQRGQAALVSIFLGKSAKAKSTSGDDEVLVRDLRARVGQVKLAGAGSSLLRYVLNRSIQIEEDFFARSPFELGKWNEFAGLEQYWFPSLDAVVEFFDGGKGRELLSELGGSFSLADSVCVAGLEKVVVKKDLDI